MRARLVSASLPLLFLFSAVPGCTTVPAAPDERPRGATLPSLPGDGTGESGATAPSGAPPTSPSRPRVRGSEPSSPLSSGQPAEGRRKDRPSAGASAPAQAPAAHPVPRPSPPGARVRPPRAGRRRPAAAGDSGTGHGRSTVRRRDRPGPQATLRTLCGWGDRAGAAPSVRRLCHSAYG